MEKRVIGLDNALQIWQDYMYLNELSILLDEGNGVVSDPNRKFTISGPVKYHKELRSHLLNAVNEEELDAKRFQPSPEMKQHIMNSAGSTVTFLPQSLFAWCRSSRKVYSIPEELQMLLSCTSLKNLSWNDVSWPFPAFYLELPIPIVAKNFSEPYNAVLVSKGILDSGEEIIQVDLFSLSVSRYKKISYEERTKMNDLILKRKFNECHFLFNKIAGRYNKNRSYMSTFHVSSRDFDKPITTPATELYYSKMIHKGIDEETGVPINLTDDDVVWSEALHIVIGLLAYIMSLDRGGKQECIKNIPYERPFFLNAVDKLKLGYGVDLFKIASKYTLTDEMKIYYAQSKKDGVVNPYKGVHFRTAHWRRSPGSGSDREAPRCVYVRETIVGRHNLESGALPNTTGNTVK